MLPGAVTRILTLFVDIAWLLHSGEIFSIRQPVFWYLFFTVIHTIVHELGHLAGGLFSGYHFLLIQLGNIRVSRNREGVCGLSVKRHFHSQCVMIPSAENNLAYKSYLSGGILGNALLCAIGLVMCLLFDHCLWGQLFFSGIPKIVGNAWPICGESHLSDGGALYILHLGNWYVRHDYVMYLRLYEICFRGLSYDREDFCYERNKNAENDCLIFYNNMMELQETKSV